ncbi:type IV pilus biogenesis/stability protein PilW [Vibrio parahaemolyticus]|uniref:type IV pilus biogenesis/stability protein PilW n=1 Tax=Vibrio parahaemolyticus TaxID=670 RepID=UPI000812F6E7|nr:type IV pilus biogenesis/stability protein PilW [Vibrio parahaemolyticus]EGQ8308813.1 type IV pilus biogenesis/stability protein PilW [Vibrio parahaemolyticus]EGQ8851504.1 type IV pilus biogenesis/stability protein PilW [Vibrio parahaemolyticus]EGQ8856128.1 type IV pilus biogenesis/stability protein PilW [Vibrio parahaemolyticus]EGQ8875617.1 type IV pilus biogenesis/stability protein PilW [Vibrio parahaemolyticus]EGQ8994896.1 type IV pilus biogenesis/stability protein PilW [Vibrio parahaemo
MKTVTLSALMLMTQFALVGCVTVKENGAPIVKADPVAMAESRIALGLGYLEGGNMIRAHDNLQQALSHAPQYYRAQLSMAHYYETVGEDAKAEDMYKRSLRQHTKNGNVLNNYGTFLCKRSDFQQADQMFNRAIEQPYYYLIPASYENAAFCALKSQDKDKAKYYFTRAIDHDPHRPKSILQLAKLEIESGNFTDARIRLMRFNQMYGVKKPSLQLMIELERAAGNEALEKKYVKQLERMS